MTNEVGRVSEKRTLSSRAFDGIDIAATALFAVEGSAAAAAAGYDLLGILALGFIVALAGGILRDVLLGDAPPAAFRSPSRIVVALLAAAATFVFVHQYALVPTLVIEIMDAAGMALFAVTGAQKAIDHGANLWVVCVLGLVAATGGGVLRDVILDVPPYVFTQSVYGTAALAAALATGAIMRLFSRPALASSVGFGLGFALRTAALVWGWQLPRVG